MEKGTVTDWIRFQTGLANGPYPVGRYGDVEAEYHSLAEGPALVDRACRGLIEVKGRDRAAWLHNLTTNEVKNLPPGEGNHAYALNVKGRILFELNLIIRTDSIWLDLDRDALPQAMSHLDRYIITEDVSLADRSDAFVRMGMSGERVKAVLHEWGAGHAAAMPWCGAVDAAWNDSSFVIMRTDFAGPFGVELFVSAPQAVRTWERLTDRSGAARAQPAGHEAVQIRRIEAGLPWPGREIDEECLPAELGRFERSVSYTKGCYLGQEVVERMRTRDVVARRLVGLMGTADFVPQAGAPLHDQQGAPVGKVTSVCQSLLLRHPIALGFVKTASASAGTVLHGRAENGEWPAIVVDLPFVPLPETNQ